MNRVNNNPVLVAENKNGGSGANPPKTFVNFNGVLRKLYTLSAFFRKSIKIYNTFVSTLASHRGRGGGVLADLFLEWFIPHTPRWRVSETSLLPSSSVNMHDY